MRAVATLLLASSLFAMNAHAQSKKELVNKVVSLQMAQVDQFSGMLAQQPLQPMLNQVRQILGTQVPADKREATAKSVEEAVRAYIKDVQPGVRASLVKNAPSILGAKLESSFNEAELKQIVQTLESPVLKRFNQIGNEMQQAMIQKAAADNQALIQEKLKALDAKLVELLGIKPPAGGASK